MDASRSDGDLVRGRSGLDDRRELKTSIGKALSDDSGASTRVRERSSSLSGACRLPSAELRERVVPSDEYRRSSGSAYL